MSELPPPYEPDWNVPPTADSYQQLLDDTYPELTGHELDASQPAENRAAIVEQVRERALASPEAYEATAYAAYESAEQPNEILRGALRVEMPNMLSRPYESAPDLTPEQIENFQSMLIAIDRASDERFKYRDADSRAQAMNRQANGNGRMYVHQERDHWEGYDGNPGRRDALAGRLYELLESNPNYGQLVVQHIRHLLGSAEQAEGGTRESEALLERNQAINRADKANTTNPNYIATRQELMARRKHQKAVHTGAEPMTTVGRRGTSPDEAIDPAIVGLEKGELASWHNRVPEGVPLTRWLRTMRPRRQLRENYDAARREYRFGRHGDGVPSPFGATDKYSPRDPALDSELWYYGLEYREARSALQVAEAGDKLNANQAILSRAEMRAETFEDILDAANQRLRAGIDAFQEEHGRLNEKVYRSSLDSYEAEENFYDNGYLPIENEYRMTLSLNDMAEYINTLDEAIANTDRSTRAGTYQQLVNMRTVANGTYNRQRSLREAIHIVIAEERGVDPANGYFGQFGAVETGDGGVCVQPSDFTYYEDGSYMDPWTIPPTRRKPDGSPL